MKGIQKSQKLISSQKIVMMLIIKFRLLQTESISF
jgi:hypothetical protein